MTLLLALLLSAFPSTDKTSWMRPDSFHLIIGMERAAAEEALVKWHPKQGKDANELVIDYSDDKSLTLEFRNDRLKAVRFELFVFLPEIRKVFDEKRSFLEGAYGKPRKETKSVLIYDNMLPNVMVVAKDDPASEQGKQGIGVLAVRYYDPRD